MDLKEGGHSSRIFKLLFNDTKIVSCSQDQVRDLRTVAFMVQILIAIHTTAYYCVGLWDWG